MNLIPHIGILIRDEVTLDLHHAADDLTVLRNDTADELNLPAQKSARTERLDDLRPKGVARCKYRYFLRVEVESEHILPNCCGRFAEACIALIRRIVLEYVLLTPIGTIGFEIESLLPRLL